MELDLWCNAVLALIGLILMGIIIDLGGNPQKDRIGFRYWYASPKAGKAKC